MITMTEDEFSQTTKSLEDLMVTGQRTSLYLREDKSFREVKGIITEIGESYIKIDTFKSKRIPLECVCFDKEKSNIS